MHIPPEFHLQDELGALATLQVQHVDAANGYKTGAEKADAQMRPILEKLVALHQQSAAEAASILIAHGGQPDPDGSWMSMVHETLMSIRGLFGKIDDDVIASIINGEERILSQIGSVLSQEIWSHEERQAIETQRDRLNTVLANLREMKDS